MDFNEIVVKQEIEDKSPENQCIIGDNMITETNTSSNTNNNSNNLNTNHLNSNPRLRRGRKNRRIGGKVDVRAKLERSRQSARECRARKKLRYQYLEDLVVKRELANIALKQELQMFRELTKSIDSGHKPPEVIKVEEEKRKNNRRA